MPGRREMGTGALRTVLASAGALLVLVALPCSAALATAESAVSPLPASNYEVRHVCMAPAPGYAGCLAMRLVPKTEAARARVAHPLAISPDVKTGVEVEKASECAAAYGASCFDPQDLRDAYFPGEQPEAPVSKPQTIALVDAYNDLTIESDLKTYDKEFGLPECTSANKCFEKVNELGETGNLPFPATSNERATEETACTNGNKTACKEVEEADGWTVEMSLDVEVSHAICQNCRIVLVEANSTSFADLEEAEKTAAGVGATEISNSWGGSENDETSTEDNKSPFNHPGIVITAAAGDDGYLDWSAEKSSERGYADYPASSPHVVAVGGTRLSLTTGDEWASETVWNGDGAGGGGCSVELAAPAWQESTSDWSSVGCGTYRAVADVSADADPYTGVAIYDSTPESPSAEEAPGWAPVGGTSLASPLIASVFALAGGANGVEYPARTLYENELKLPHALHDVVSGSNGECKKKPPYESDGTSSCSVTEEATNSHCVGTLKCIAGPGYDAPTGVGTPNGIAAFLPPVSEADKSKEGSKGNGTGEEASTNGAGSGNSGNSSGTGQTGEPSPSKTASPSTTSGVASLKLTAFALTPTALLALNRARPKASSVRFAFTLSAAARVRATLAKLVRVHGHNRWVPVPGALTFSAAKGRNQQHLTGSDGLTSGRYRLTLAPRGGAARTLTFQVA